MEFKKPDLNLEKLGFFATTFAVASAFAIVFGAGLIVLQNHKQELLAKVDRSIDNMPLVGSNKGDEYWANEIMKGGYILHFRHAERDKWIDVQMYDALESDVHTNGPNQSRMAESSYFDKAVCLNERGTVQAKAMGEHITRIGMPIGHVISSPSCRSRQTANLTFGGHDRLHRDLVHRGPYLQDSKDHISDLKALYLSLPMESGKNTIVSAHNKVVDRAMFNNSGLKFAKLTLEEGGFYVISKTDNGLKLEHEFHNFMDFIHNFYKRS